MIAEVDFDLPPERLFAAISDRPGSFFLDSALAADGLGAYSIIGFDPFLTFRARGREIALRRNGRVETIQGDPLKELRRLLREHGPSDATRGALPFAGGAVGYFAYELGAEWEGVLSPWPSDARQPDAEFGFYAGAIVYDHAAGKYFMAAQGAPDPVAVGRRMEETVRAALTERRIEKADTFGGTEPRAFTPRSDYLAAVRRIREYIRAGDVYQVNLTQRFDAPFTGDPYALYQRLRARSPSPFGGFLNFGDLQIVSSSPERFLRVHGDRVETRPIKGTRPRGRTPEEDARLARELLESEKDRAELLMIVDLERNDLGRVCAPGSIRVDELYRLESHPVVHHLVANVSGRLRPECDVCDLLRATFPGGSITGAPKIRAMQIIAELERCRRHLYTGAIGHMGFDGDCDFNIAIRTIVCGDGQAQYHVGGGIVWDSEPEAEYQETLAKGRAMHAALAGAP